MKGHKHFLRSPQNFLVGYTGTFLYHVEKLPHLRITNKYKQFLKEEDVKWKQQVYQMSQLLQIYENITSMIINLTRENQDGGKNTNLLSELEEQRILCRKTLFCLEARLQGKLPNNLCSSLKRFHHQSRIDYPRKVVPRKRKFTERKEFDTNAPQAQFCEESKPKLPDPNTSKKTSVVRKPTANSHFASVKTQLFVRDKDLTLKTIHVDLFLTGENLYHTLKETFGDVENCCNVVYGAEKVDMNKSLWDQGIIHGSTIDLDVNLCGGMAGKETLIQSTKSSPEKKDLPVVAAKVVQKGNPETWKKLQVKEWITNICQECEIEIEEVSSLMTLNGKGLSVLSKEDWEGRSKHGDLLFKLWHKLERVKTDVKSDTTGDTDTLLEDVMSAQAEEGLSFATVSHDSCTKDNDVTEQSDTATKGLFGEVDNFENMPNAVSFDDLLNDGTYPAQEIGSVITVTGICSRKPECRRAAGMLLLRDDPQGAVSGFNELKIDIKAKRQIKDLNMKAIENLLKKIKTGTHVAVRGRIENLGDDYVSKKPCYEMVPYKLVVDSDSHALVYITKKVIVFSRQHSQSWYSQCGIYPAMIDDKSLHIGDKLEKTPRRYFCESDVSPEELKKIIVAFKNSYDGDIVVGVRENGEVTGMEVTQKKLLHRREQISNSIGEILPGCDERISICENNDNASQMVGKKCFVSVMRLGESAVNDEEEIKVVCWIHVTKGTAPVHFVKQTDIHAYLRVGAKTKLFSDYNELFNRLESLTTRTIEPIPDKESYIAREIDKAIDRMNTEQKYKLFKTIHAETERREFKAIYGSIDVIEKKYLARYACGFLNASGGDAYFGVEEDVNSKEGYAIGVVINPKEREALVKKYVTILDEFYPPVNTSQYVISFPMVSVSRKCILKYPKTYVGRDGKCVLLRGPPDEIGTKWTKCVNDKSLKQRCSVIRVKPQSYIIVAEKMNSNSEQLMELVEEFQTGNSKYNLDEIDVAELDQILKDLCLVVLQVDPSSYPIHMTKPIKSFVFDDTGELSEISQDKLMSRFGEKSRSQFDIHEFLKDVDEFDASCNSYILVASPFNLPKSARDLYGLVIPKWTLAIDFDQMPKDDGHVYNVFERLHDIHQTERDRYLRRPQDPKLDLNPDHGICWFAVRGYKELADSLSEDSHGMWNMTHRDQVRSLLSSELTSCVKPNRLNVVTLWDEGQSGLIDSLRTILEDILSINGERTVLTFVCSTQAAHVDISRKLIKPLQETYWSILKKDSVYVASPHALAKCLAPKLPAPYRPEDNYQLPHKINSSQGVAKIIPEALPQRLRQNIQGRLKMMYMNRGAWSFRKQKLSDERKKFYSGSEITEFGLFGKIGIERARIVALEKEFHIFSNDKKSHVSFIVVKADRGAGTTTMCLQFLFKKHEYFPCAQLIEIQEGLVGSIEKINQKTNLPMLLLVDEDIANLQDFFDFRKEAERRNVNIIFLLVEPAEAVWRKKSLHSRKTNQRRNIGDNIWFGASPYAEIELRRELEPVEIDTLTEELIKIDESKRERLSKLKDRARGDETLRTFAHFSLTAFGRNFKGLGNFVGIRLEKATQEQKDVLAFLSLTHLFTDSLLPVNALSGFLGKDIVVLENVFQDSYLRELLSPSSNETNARRISFVEVAEEILKQLASTKNVDNQGDYWTFIKDVSLQMAKEVLSIYIRSKKVDRLTKKLFVTSEFESEKFSSLIRSMKEESRDTARDTLLDLVEVFNIHTSFRAHLLAHLAKFYMIEYNDFKKAKPRIEEAIKDQRDDVLLHHIHGDIIRRHIQILKKRKEVDMEVIVSHAIESSACFHIVRNKHPYMSHGYVSDAMVRVTVMQAANKKMGGGKDSNYVKYLIQLIEELKAKGIEISIHEKYLLGLIPDAYAYLSEGTIDHDHKEKWKKKFLDCLGKLDDLNVLCEKLKAVKHSFSCSEWIHEIVIQTHSLLCVLEIETKELTPIELERRIQKIEECGSSSKLDERSMKYWIRYARYLPTVPPLKDVREKVKKWVQRVRTKRGGISPHAEFYNYVVNLLVALKDPKDREKMEKAAKLIKRRQIRKYSKKEDVTLPLEWLNPRNGRHINSIDSLLHHDDLVKETVGAARERRPGREIIEGCLHKKNVIKWKGTVKEIKSDWQGTIALSGYIDVRFVPQNVQPSMPSTGDEVWFCLSFDGNGPNAWMVGRPATARKGFPRVSAEHHEVNSEEDVSSEDEQLDSCEEIVQPTPLHCVNIQVQKRKEWEHYVGRRMQGAVVQVNSEKGFGFIKHPDVTDILFFHAAQLVNPVTSLAGTINKNMVLEFCVEKLREKVRAADIHIVEDANIKQEIRRYVESMKELHDVIEPDISKNAAASPTQEGVVLRLTKKNYGFIRDNNPKVREDVFFHLNNLVNPKQLPMVGQQVQYRLSKTKNGFEAVDVVIKGEHTSGSTEGSNEESTVYKNKDR